MPSAGHILWIDNDTHYLAPFRAALHDSGFEVTTAETVSEATNLLTKGNYNLVLLDVMMPTTARDEAEGYGVELSDFGYKTGLAFYVKNRDLLLHLGVPVMVTTVRLDQRIIEEFVAAGLPRECFVTKYSVADPDILLEKINFMLIRQRD
jgi:CheY-like chemotaxis protein